MWMFLAQMTTRAPEAAKGQGEYAQAWALVGILMFFGLLVVLIPRPRKVDIPENDKKNREKHHVSNRPSGKGKPGDRKQPAKTFQAAINQNKPK